MIKKYMGYYYSVKKVKGGFGYEIYNHYPKKGRKVLERNSEVADTKTEAEQDCRDAISYHYV
jgi:hypothetical protein